MNDRFGDRFGTNPLAHLINKAREKEARTDLSLTGLPNKIILAEDLERILLNLERGGARDADPDYVLCFLLDLNRFKFLNDTYGYDKGNEALRLLTKYLKALEVERGGKVYRLGGDEFILIQAGKGSLNQPVGEIANRIREKLNSEHMSVDTPKGKFDITVSIGGAVSRRGEFKEAPSLLKEAGDKMHEDKTANGFERGK